MTTSLPTNWTETTIRDVTLPTKSWNPQRDLREEFWYIDVSAVSRESCSIRAPQRVKGLDAPSRARKIIATADALFATVRPTLRRVAFVDHQFDNQIASTAFCVVRANRDRAVPRFLYYLLLTDFLNDEIAKFESGASYPAINDKDVLDRTIPLPPRPEQEKIAAALWKVQRAIDIEEKLIATTRELKQAAMLQLFTHGIRGEPQKETKLGPVPESWDLVPADRIFKLTSGSKRPADLAPTPSAERPFPVFGGNGIMGYSSAWFLDTDKCLVIGRVGEYCGAIHIAHGKVWITDNALYAKEWLLESVRVDYLTAFLDYYDLNRFKRTAGQPLVTQSIINEHHFPVPSPTEQKEIAQVLEAVDHKIVIHERKRATLKELFKTLLHKLTTGEISVVELDIDTSDVVIQ